MSKCNHDHCYCTVFYIQVRINRMSLLLAIIHASYNRGRNKNLTHIEKLTLEDFQPIPLALYTSIPTLQYMVFTCYDSLNNLFSELSHLFVTQKFRLSNWSGEPVVAAKNRPTRA